MKGFSPYSLLAILILAFTLSGCGGDNSGNPGGTTYTPGQASVYMVGGVSFNMRYAPGGLTFPTGTDDSGSATVANAFWIAETEVTYELWTEVYDWARGDINRDGIGNDNGDGTRADGGLIYSFANAGREGHDGIEGDPLTGASQEPVTYITWRDAMVWCNALTEYYYRNSDNCVYYEDAAYTTPIRTSTNNPIPNPLESGQEDQPYLKAITTGNTGMANCSAKGFRLPTSDEWQLAARYHFKDGTQWLPGDHVSGDDTGYCHSPEISTAPSTIFGKYAWYYRNSGDSSQPVATTELKNALNLSDMSGNVWEWCFDWHPKYSNSLRVKHGGCWADTPSLLKLGFVSCDSPDYGHSFIGFRPVRTH